MSNTTSIVDVIQHYQKSIDISQDNEPRLLHCINKLYKLPIKVEHLQKTGVGKTVNSLRKFNGEIGVAAKALVTKWKAMVAAEEESNEPMSSNKDTEITEDNDGSNDGSNGQNQMLDENSQRHETHESREQRNKQTKLNKDHHNHKSNSNNNNKLSSPSEVASCVTTTSSYHKESKESEKHSKSNDLSKHGEIEKVKHRHRKSADSTSTKNSSKRIICSSSNSNHKDGERHRENSEKHKSRHHSHRHRSSNENDDALKKDKNANHHRSDTNKLENREQHKRPHKVEHEVNDNELKSPPAKKIKITSSESKCHKIRRHEDDNNKEDDGFDSSMGANFADVLGMLNVPKKKPKKTSKTSPTVTSSQDVINKDATTTTPKQSINYQAGNVNSLLGSGNVNVDVRSSINSRTPISVMPLTSSSKSLTTKPEMLAPTAKLEPLDPNIALELPTISTNYKPMPLNPTVMDCVFNALNTSNSTKPARTLSDAEALNHGISSKTIRTKVYSGIRTGQIYQVSSLFDLCIRFLQKNIDALEYTGGVPYDVLEPVLKKATPQQLFTFEDYNPYLMEDTDTLWQVHVSRSYRTQKRLENETWREMFLRCQEEEERKLNYLADSIKQSQKIAAAPIRKTQLAFLDTMVKPPRNVQRKQEQYGTKAKLVATPATRVASLSAIVPNAAKLGDIRLKIHATNRDNAQISSTTNSVITTGNISRPKKAPLMQKTLQFIRGRLKR